MPTDTELNLALYAGLLAIDPSLRPGYRARITRTVENAILYSVHAIGDPKPAYKTEIKNRFIHTKEDTSAILDIVWQELRQKNLIRRDEP